MTERFDRYRQLTAPLGEQPARALIDKLQVLALTQPETLHEIEAFIDRGLLPGQRVTGVSPSRSAARSGPAQSASEPRTEAPSGDATSE